MKKFKAFIQKNVHIIIALVLIIVLFNSMRIGTVKKTTQAIQQNVIQVDSTEKVILSKIENTTGENLFSLVNALMKNNERLDSVISNIQRLETNNSDLKKITNEMLRATKVIKSDINKIKKEIDGLQTIDNE